MDIMAFVTMGPMLKRAQAARYGIAAFNMIDYNSARSIIEGAAQLDASIIVQVSVKTIKHWGYRPIATWVPVIQVSEVFPRLAQQVCLFLFERVDVMLAGNLLDQALRGVESRQLFTHATLL